MLSRISLLGFFLLPSSIAFYGCTTALLFSSSWARGLLPVLSYFIKAAVKLHVHEHVFSFFLGRHLEVELAVIG